MDIMSWEERFELGVPEVDRQHRYLFELVGELQRRQDQEPSREELITLLNNLANYACDHFSAEEQLMDKIGFEERARHGMLHGQFTGKVADIAIAWGHGEDIDLPGLTEWLSDWLKVHILGEDQKIATLMHNQNASVKA